MPTPTLPRPGVSRVQGSRMPDHFEVLEKVERGGRVFLPSDSSDLSRNAFQYTVDHLLSLRAMGLIRLLDSRVMRAANGSYLRAGPCDLTPAGVAALAAARDSHTTAPSATTTAMATVQEFFEAYRRHDVDRMVALCTLDATFQFGPLGESGKGRVRGTGDALWRAIIDAIPDLTNEVKWSIDGDAGKVICRVAISGTQTKDLGEYKSRGRRETLEHLFICHVDRDGKIDDITSNADLFRPIEDASLM
jgi:ketosteroid isomerase-like protein